MNRRDFLKSAALISLTPIAGNVKPASNTAEFEWDEDALAEFLYRQACTPTGKDKEALERLARTRAILALDLKKRGIEPDISYVEFFHTGTCFLTPCLHHWYASQRREPSEAHIRHGFDIYHDEEGLIESRNLYIKASRQVTEHRFGREKFTLPITPKHLSTCIIQDIYKSHAKYLLFQSKTMTEAAKEDIERWTTSIKCDNWDDVKNRWDHFFDGSLYGDEGNDARYIARHLVEWGIFPANIFPA